MNTADADAISSGRRHFAKCIADLWRQTRQFNSEDEVELLIFQVFFEMQAKVNDVFEGVAIPEEWNH